MSFNFASKPTEIAITETQLESFFLKTCSQKLKLKPIAQQMQLDCGVVDVFCHDAAAKAFYVVELKVEPLQSKHLTQVLSYTYELRSKYPHKDIRPLLIGPGIQDKRLASCLGWFHEAERNLSACEYRLYNFDALIGIDYTGYDGTQRIAESGRIENLWTATYRLYGAGRIPKELLGQFREITGAGQ